MAFENGSGQGGGNSSVWFEVRHGSDAKPQTLEAAGLGGVSPSPASVQGKAHHERPRQGQVKLENDGKCACLLIHDRTNLDDLGADDHKGMFRVRLRIRKETMEALIANETDPKRKAELKKYWAALPTIAAKLQKYTGEVPHGGDEVWENTDG